jgi:uncharacterized protein (TIGR02453 family)
MSKESPFTKQTFAFLKELEANNNREWFQDNKQRYEDDVRSPALEFIRLIKPKLLKVSECFAAVDKKVGGSLMRPYRDTRFSKDKTPYKTNVGIQFRHITGKDAHAPGYYVHLEPENCFLGLGIWMPDSSTLRKLRAAIADDPKKWLKVRNAKKFTDTFRLVGESLKTAPKGYPKDHPQIEDLRRKSLLGLCDLTPKEIVADGFVESVIKRFKAGSGLLAWECEALGLPF